MTSGEKNKEVRPLSTNELIVIHNRLVEKFGGTCELRDVSLFESVTIAPFQSVFGQDLYPLIFDKASKYLLDFSRYQVFADGNKRMSLASAQDLLLKNGLTLTLTEEQAYNLVLDIAVGKMTEIEEISDLIKNHHKFLEAPDAFMSNVPDEDAAADSDNEYLEARVNYIAAQYGNALAELAKGPDDPKGELTLKREERDKN